MRGWLFFAIAAAGAASQASATITIAQLRLKPPAASYSTTRRPDDFAKCVAETMGKWGSPTIYKSGNDVSVAFVGDGVAMLLLDISESGTINVFRANKLVSFKKETEACI